MKRVNNQTQPSLPRGVAAVELALVLPVFVLLMLGIIECSRALMANHVVLNAAREGARAGMFDDSTNADVEASVQSFLTRSLGNAAEKAIIEINVLQPNGQSTSNVSNAVEASIVSVDVTLPYSAISLMPAKWLGKVTLAGRQAMRRL